VFTGLIEDLGTVRTVEHGGEGATLRIASRLGAELQDGDSVAVNGVCLTATAADPEGFSAEAMNETLRVSALDELEPGQRVNLELAVRAGDRLGGHIVQGHADGTAEVIDASGDGFARRLRVRLDPQLAQLAVPRGSIALDGVSLTISGLGEDWLEVSLIPETLERTNLGEATPGRKLNVECDMVGKYVQRLMSPLTITEGAQGDG
jgi:riboflavin synthase